MAQALDSARAARAAPPLSHFPLFIAACYRSLSVRHRVAAKVVVAFQVEIKSVQEQLLTIQLHGTAVGKEGQSECTSIGTASRTDRGPLCKDSNPLLRCTNVHMDRSFSLGLRSFSCNITFGDHRKGEAMRRRNWWRSNGRGRTPGYGGTVKMAVGALVAVVLVVVLLELLGLP